MPTWPGSSSTWCSATRGGPFCRRPASPSHDAARGTTQRPLGLPGWIYVPAAVGAAFVLLPLVAIVAKVDWTHFGSLVTSEGSRAAFWLSVRTSTASTLLCVVFGVPMALVLARRDFRGAALVRSLVLLP